MLLCSSIPQTHGIKAYTRSIFTTTTTATPRTLFALNLSIIMKGDTHVDEIDASQRLHAALASSMAAAAAAGAHVCVNVPTEYICTYTG